MATPLPWRELIYRQVGEHSGFKKLAATLSTVGADALIVDDITEPAFPFFIGWIGRALKKRRLWVVCRDSRQMDSLAGDAEAWCEGKVVVFPQHSGLYAEDALPDPDVAADRLDALHRIRDGIDAGKFLFLHHESLDEPVPTEKALQTDERSLRTGDRLTEDDLFSSLDEQDYRETPQVVERGQYARRGGIIDLFEWQGRQPLRIELFDDEIESLRYFDADTQVTTRREEKVDLVLAAEINEQSQLRDYLKPDDLVVSVDYPESGDVRLTTKTSTDGIPPPWRAERSPLADFDAGDFVLQDSRRNTFVEQCREWLDANWNVYLLFHNRAEQKRFEELIDLKELGLTGIHCATGHSAAGFILPGARCAVIGAAELFGQHQYRRASRLARKAAGRRHAAQVQILDLEEDDFVVHVEYGIGRFEGFQTEEGEEVMVIRYADDARVYVQLDRGHLVSRYIGVGRTTPKLDKIGAKRWGNARERAKKAIRDYAGQLLAVQAQRQSEGGFAHEPDHEWQREFEGSFVYRETRDQLRAIEDTKLDMESSRPMDRLICGDVGFGKTEVAIRAAFKTVMSGKQAAILAPTTVLAQQHYETLRERMSEYPVKIGLLSRFCKPAEQKKIVRELAVGGIDIVVGTHRLISKDILFSNLGLVVIDEEQRFGVRHKERFKEMFRLVDVLTLTATPIPRTLYLSLMGARDMSVIDTPPPSRLPVHTTVIPYNERVIRDSIQRELARGGQVFYLHNRVKDIEHVKAKIENLCPEAKVGVGHGQMDENALEEIMHRFIEGAIDVLVCTTIIESGVDIPNANTIIIERADCFGLADLYQLRGRVGRAERKAYAIMLLPPGMLTTTEARKRVQAIRQHSSLGAGFRIALRDLEIRGSGNLLGTEQSGHIAAVGFDLYCRLLKQSIKALNGDTLPSQPDVRLSCDFVVLNEAEYLAHGGKGVLAAFIPSKYVSDSKLRILAYRQIAELESESEIRELREEWRDRFGKPPEPVENLLFVIRVKLAAAERRVSSVEVRGRKLMLTRNGELIMVANRFPQLQCTRPRKKLEECLSLLETL